MATEIHGLDGFALLKEEMIAIIKSIDVRIFLWANKDRLYFKCAPQAEPFIRVFFNQSKSEADIFCHIDLEDIPEDLATKFPSARLDATSKFGTVRISLKGSHEVMLYRHLFHLAMRTGRRKS